MNKAKRLGLWAAIWAACLLILALLHIADFGFGYGVAATEVNSFANAVAAWVAFAFLLSAIGGERGEGRKPWIQIAIAYGIIAVIETVFFYFISIDPYGYGIPWGGNLVIYAAYILLGIAIAGKAGRLRGRRRSDWAAIAFFFGLTLVLTFAGVLLFYLVPHPGRMPFIAKVLMLMFLALDLSVLTFAIIVAFTYAGGTGGVPWRALAWGLFFAGSSNIFDIYGGLRGFPDAVVTNSLAALATFASFSAISWAGLRQREILRIGS